VVQPKSPETVRALSAGVWMRETEAAVMAPAIASLSSPWPASMRSSMVAWSRPIVNCHASGLAVRTSSVAWSHSVLRSSVSEEPGVRAVTL
jgi:hypothetical protein